MRFPVLAVRDVASATERTVKKIDAIAKIIVVKTTNGTEHTVHFLDRTVSHGAELSPGLEATGIAGASRSAPLGWIKQSRVLLESTEAGRRILDHEYERISVPRNLIRS